MKFSRAWLFVLVVGGLSISAFAKEDWQIENFETAVAIQRDSSLIVTEMITVNFSTSRHGIFRDILTNEIDLKVLGVSDEAGQDQPYRLEWISGGGRTFRRIRIGDPNQEVRGRQIYVIQYRASWALGFLKDFDELYWNATGNEWPVPIPSVTSVVTLPEDVAPDQLKLRCFTGMAGSTKENCSIQIINARTVRYQTQGLSIGEGLTVVAGFAKGLVKEPTPTERLLRQLRTYATDAAVPLLTLLIVLVLWRRSGRDPWTKRSILPQWNPPEKLSPAEVGVIFDERADLRDISATIIDLATHGYLKIRRLEEKGLAIFGALRSVSSTVGGLMFAALAVLWMVMGAWVGGPWYLFALGLLFLFFGLKMALGALLQSLRGGETRITFQNTDYELVRLKSDDPVLKAHEQKLLQALFDGQQNRKLSELENKFYKHLPELRRLLYESVVKQGYFVRNPDSVRAAYYGVGGVLAVGGFGLIFLLGTVNPFFGASLVLSGLIVLGFAPLMPQKTSNGVRVAQDILGLREYLRRAEKQRLEVLNAPEHNPETFEKLLPYAISLAVAEAWAEQFEGLYSTPPSWYEGTWGPGPFSSRHLVSGLREFSCNAERACTSTPSRSGSSSGGFLGGSAGGGRGGGGGGAW